MYIDWWYLWKWTTYIIICKKTINQCNWNLGNLTSLRWHRWNDRCINWFKRSIIIITRWCLYTRILSKFLLGKLIKWETKRIKFWFLLGNEKWWLNFVFLYYYINCRINNLNLKRIMNELCDYPSIKVYKKISLVWQ